MKRSLISLILMVILFSCQMPEEKEEKGSSIEMKYDNGIPAFSFYFPSDNNYEYAIRFPYNYIIKNYVGKKINAIRIYLAKTPSLAYLKIYQCNFSGSNPASEDNGGYPGFGTASLITARAFGVTYAFKQNAWNTFDLSVPITIPANKDIWIVADITAPANTDAILNYDTSSGHIDANYYRTTAGSGSWLNANSAYNLNVMIRAVVE